MFGKVLKLSIHEGQSQIILKLKWLCQKICISFFKDIHALK